MIQEGLNGLNVKHGNIDRMVQHIPILAKELKCKLL